jgi:hypothetical protein
VSLSATPRTRGLVLIGAFAAALQGASGLPLAFAIQDPANRLTAGAPAVTRRVADRLLGRFIAPRAVARKSRKKICCVTTRRRNLGVLRGLERGLGTLTARTLSFGMLGFRLCAQAPSGLSLRRLPALHLPPAFRLLAVTLVPTSRLVPAPAAFAQADPRTRSTPTGTTTALWITMAAAHGSAISQGTARGERTIVLLGRLSKPAIRRSLASILPGRN